MKQRNTIWPALFFFFLANPGLFALDDLTAGIKQFLDQRADDFAAIRKDPHGGRRRHNVHIRFESAGSYAMLHRTDVQAAFFK